MAYKYITHKLSRWEQVLKYLGFHIHDKQLFVVGEVCLVKCVQCGAESIPWHVPLHLRDWAKEAHKDDVSELVKVEKRLREST
jgi:hypothetical protein